MKPFQFFQKKQEIPVEPDFQVDLYPIEGRNPQHYRMNYRSSIPLNQIPNEHLAYIRRDQERVLMQHITETLDIRHEIISSDEFGFTMRTELFI